MLKSILWSGSHQNVQGLSFRALFVAALLALVGSVLLTLSLASATPWLGLQLSVEPQAEHLIIERIYPGSPLYGRISAGQNLQALRLGNGDIFPLETQDLVEEPDFIIEYAELNRFFSRQQVITKALQQTRVELLIDSQWYTSGTLKRPLYSLHTMFWFQLFIGLFAALTGLAVWRFQRNSATTRLFALTGLAFMLITFSAAIYSSRELAMEGELIRNLARLNHFASMLMAPAFVGLLWYYPNRLHRLPLPPLLIAVYQIIWIADTAQWMPNTDWGIRIPMVTGLFMSLILAVLQWHRSRHQPIERTALKWFLFSIYLGGATFVSIIFIAMLLGFEPVIPQGYAFGIVVLMYLGVALGISRYRLFDLDRWWFGTWLWLLSGALVIVADLLLIYLLELRPALALGAALLVVGWLYFPLRQWLLRRLLPSREVKLESLFPELIRLGLVANDSEQVERIWRSLLQQVFQPLYLQRESSSSPEPQIVNQGLELQMPGMGHLAALKLGYPMQGQRLFGREDQALAHSLWQLTQNVLSVREAYEEGAEQERQRIYADLHDDLGAKLLSMIYRAKDPREADLARAALQDLRDVVSRSTRNDSNLQELLADWQDEVRQRLESARIALDWQQPESFPQHQATQTCSLHLGRILREAVSNTIKHAEADAVEIEIICPTPQQLQIIYRDNGRGLQQASPGRGMLNMQRRSELLGGQLQWQSLEGHLQIEIQIPLHNPDQSSQAPHPPVKG